MRIVGRNIKGISGRLKFIGNPETYDLFLAINGKNGTVC